MGIHSYLQRAAETIVDTTAHLPEDRVNAAITVIADALMSGAPLLVCGNGGSASDAMHITGELVGRFLKERKALNCICLSDNPAVITAWSNDYSYDTVFERQVEAYGRAGGVIWGLSTSGNSQNVCLAFDKASRIGMTTIGTTGKGGGKLAARSNILLDVASTHTPEIQQIHLCLFHYICEEVERRTA